jgi:hypothetical protein
VKRVEALRRKSTPALYDIRLELDLIHKHPSTPEHVKDAAAVLMNFYGSELDARMSEGEQ